MYNSFVRSDNTYVCIITGEEKYIPPSLLKAKVKKYGSLTEYRKYHVSRAAAKLLKQGKTVDEVRAELNSPSDLPDVDLEILIRLKLVKINKRKGKKEHNEAKERLKYLNSKEFKDKMQQIKYERENQTFADWVEENTSVGKSAGGTCIRPDIFLSWNNKACDGCPYYEYCVCDNRRLSTEKRTRRKRR